MRVPSRRRNPIIADVFQRLIYMERRGSGFKKIIEDYEVQKKYTDELAPVFLSENDAFFLTLKNLNFVSRDNPETIKRDNPETNEQQLRERLENIKAIIRENPTVTIRAIAEILGISRQQADRAVSKLREDGILKREGNNRNGRWILIE